MPDADPLERTRRLGRRAGIIGVFGLTTAFTVVCAGQVLLQALPRGTVPSPVACRDGVRRLATAVERARAAETGGPAGGDARERFRDQLEPEWSERKGLDASCAGDAPARLALDRLDELRYAEEHAALRAAADLNARRGAVAASLQALGLTPGARPANRD